MELIFLFSIIALGLFYINYISLFIWNNIKLVLKLLFKIIPKIYKILHKYTYRLLILFFIYLGFMAIPISYNINVIGPMTKTSLAYYTNIVKILMSDKNDVLNVNVNSGGGDATLASDYLYLLRNANTTINIFIYNAGSAATVLIFAGDNLFINPKATIMFHRAFEARSDGNKIILKDNLHIAAVNDYFANRIAPLLNINELNKYINGEDVLITGEDLSNKILAKQKKDGNIVLLPDPVKVLYYPIDMSIFESNNVYNLIIMYLLIFVIIEYIRRK